MSSVSKTGGNFVAAHYPKGGKQSKHVRAGDATHDTKVGTSDYSPAHKSTPTPTTYGTTGVGGS